MTERMGFGEQDALGVLFLSHACRTNQGVGVGACGVGVGGCGDCGFGMPLVRPVGAKELFGNGLVVMPILFEPIPMVLLPMPMVFEPMPMPPPLGVPLALSGCCPVGLAGGVPPGLAGLTPAELGAPTPPEVPGAAVPVPLVPVPPVPPAPTPPPPAWPLAVIVRNAAIESAASIVIVDFIVLLLRMLRAFQRKISISFNQPRMQARLN